MVRIIITSNVVDVLRVGKICGCDGCKFEGMLLAILG